MVPQPSSFTVAKQHGQFTAGGVVSVDGWCLLSAGAKQRSCHSSDLQIIGSSFLDGYLWRARFAQGVSRRPVLKTARCLGRDRKSTRLNSSHSQISYAVFCLKKKKNKTNHTTHRDVTSDAQVTWSAVLG